MKTEEIDIVLAWVDGSDPVWREKKKERMRQQDYPSKVMTGKNATGTGI